MSEWIEKQKKNLENIRNLKPNDRLGYLVSIMDCIMLIIKSCQGWSNWLYHLGFMDKEFTLEELKQIFTHLKQFTEKFLEFDIEWTEKKKPPEKPKPSQPPTV